MQPGRAREPVLRMEHLVVILETLKQSDSPKPSSGSSPQSIESPCRALRKEPHLPPEIQSNVCLALVECETQNLMPKLCPSYPKLLRTLQKTETRNFMEFHGISGLHGPAAVSLLSVAMISCMSTSISMLTSEKVMKFQPKTSQKLEREQYYSM